MNFRRGFGILVLIAGVVMIGISFYIKKEVESGKGQIASAESQVAQGKAIFGLSDVTKPVGDVLAGSADRKIASGKRDVAYYEEMAGYLKIGGIIAIVFGGIFVLIPVRKS